MTNNASKGKSKSASAERSRRGWPSRARERSARAKPGNPLLSRWSAAFGLPPFKKIEPAHFKAAFAAALKEHKAEIARIAGETARPTFANTILALEKSGRLLDKVAAVFYNLTGAHTNEALQAIERDMAPKLAAHETAIMLNGKLFRRVEDLYQRRDELSLTDEQRRVLELRYKWLSAGRRQVGAQAKGPGG